MIMKHNTQVALFYEYWSQLALRENWYWEERNKPEKSPSTPPYKSQVSFQFKRGRKNKGEKKKERKKNPSPTNSTELELWKT